MCESVNSWLCVFGIMVLVISIAKILELSSRNQFRINGLRTSTVNNVISVLTFTTFLALGIIYLFFM